MYFFFSFFFIYFLFILINRIVLDVLPSAFCTLIIFSPVSIEIFSLLYSFNYLKGYRHDTLFSETWSFSILLLMLFWVNTYLICFVPSFHCSGTEL